MSEPFDNNFIRRFLDGQCREEEKVAFFEFLETRDSTEVMRQVWEKAQSDHQVFLGVEDKILQQVILKIHKPSPGLNISGKTENRQKSNVIAYLQNHYSWRYAAIITLFMVASFIINVFKLSGATEPLVVKELERKTHNGQHLSFVLEDGSTVYLNSGSSLTYPEHFPDSSRIVRLTGEGFFEVAHDSRRPFSVLTGEVRTTALGTSFNINHRQNKADISLVNGSVKVEIDESGNAKEVFTLSPGHELHCDLTGRSYLVDEFDIQAITAWKDGILYFENASLSKVVATLESWYDVQIQTEIGKKRNISNWSYSGKFEKQTLENVLRGMSYVEKFSYEIEGKKVRLMFN